MAKFLISICPGIDPVDFTGTFGPSEYCLSAEPGTLAEKLPPSTRSHSVQPLKEMARSGPEPTLQCRSPKKETCFS